MLRYLGLSVYFEKISKLNAEIIESRLLVSEGDTHFIQTVLHKYTTIFFFRMHAFTIYCTIQNKQVNLLMLKVAKKQPDIFDEILHTKAGLGKYLKEKCYSEYFQQLLFKYFQK